MVEKVHEKGTNTEENLNEGIHLKSFRLKNTRKNNFKKIYKEFKNLNVNQTKKHVYKKLTTSCLYKGGRNRMGRITIAHRGLRVL
jgi:ribosomal protein L2